MFLRRSLAHVSNNFFFCRYIWGSCPPPNTKKLATLICITVMHIYVTRFIIQCILLVANCIFPVVGTISLCFKPRPIKLSWLRFMKKVKIASILHTRVACHCHYVLSSNPTNLKSLIPVISLPHLFTFTDLVNWNFRIKFTRHEGWGFLQRFSFSSYDTFRYVNWYF